MYTKTKTSGLALALVFLLSALTIITPRTINAADLNAETTATVEFNAGELSLVSVATLDFGQQDISTSEETYTAKDVDSAIQVSDLRGSGEGWDLTVALSEFTHKDNDETLPGAYLTFSGTTVEDVNETNGSAPTSVSTVSLKIDSDDEQNSIFVAGDEAGMGVWELTIEPEAVELTVLPGTTYAGEYQADLTWSLQTTP